MLRILDIPAHLRPVHPAALRLPSVIQHAGGQFQIGFRKHVGIAAIEVRHRIIGRVQSLGSAILQPRNHALAVLCQRSALRP